MGERVYSRFWLVILILLLAGFGLLMCCPAEKRPFLTEQLQNYKVHYGLDLQGGSELVYQVDPKEIDATRSVNDVISDTIGIISQRIFESNIVKDPRIQQEGEDRIIIQLPGLNQAETNNIKREIERLGNLEFRLVASKNMGEEIDETTERSKYEEAMHSGEKRLAYYQKRLLEKGYRWFAPRNEKEQPYLLWVKDGYDFTGKKFRNFFKSNHEARVAIGFELKEEYKAYFGNFTGKYKNERLAIVFNNKVVAAPTISSRIEGNGVMVGFGLDELTELMKVLRSGSLEIQPELLNENTIGPSLGEDSIRLGIFAGLLGLLLVVVFILFFYRGCGLIANLALTMNIILVGTILVIWGETLTLPGIAGLILTVGMSIDANVLIFERMREEKAKMLTMKGDNAKHFEKSELLDIIAHGYDSAFTSIFDANVTTLLTAIILYVFGSGSIQGFAFTLGWGIIASFFTAIVVTRVLMTFAVRIGLMRSFSMLTWLKNPRIPFTKFMYAISAVSMIIVIIGVGIFVKRGDANYGLELKGGILAQMSLEKPLQSEQVRERLAKSFPALEVQHMETEEGSTEKGWYEFSVRLPNMNQNQIDIINKKLEEVATKIREKNSAIKQITSELTRLEEAQRYDKKTLRSLKAKNASKEELDEVQGRIEHNGKTQSERKEILSLLSKEVETLQNDRVNLTQDKNTLAGIETLRKKIEEQFATELAPTPFGTVTMGTGKFSSNYVVPVRFKTPISSEFALKTLAPYKDIFPIAEIGSQKFAVSVEQAEALAVEETKTLLQKQLDIASRIEASDITVKDKVVTITFAEAMPVSAVQKAVDKCGWAKSSIKVLDGDNTELRNFAFFLTLATEKAGLEFNDRVKLIEERLRTAFHQAEYNGKTVYFSDPFPRFTQISGLVAKAQKAKAFRAILLSLFVLLCYIGIRFPNGWSYGLGAVLALAHDVLFALGIIAIFGFLGTINLEINLTSIAALLTLVGYSLNDTIVIYDRLRENKKSVDAELWERMSFKAICEQFNKALNQTLGRTLLTSITTLLVLVCMFVFNYGKGSVLECFSFILMVGVIVGTYSSVFIATAIVLLFEKRNRNKN